MFLSDLDIKQGILDGTITLSDFDPKRLGPASYDILLGLMQVNSVGIIDQDYCGDNNTIKFPFINMRKEPVTIQKWDRIGQGMFVKIEKPEFVLVESMGGTDRGAFGSTGMR